MELGAGTHTVEVFAEDHAGNTARSALTLTTYANEFRQPLSNGRQQGEAGQTLPVKFVVLTSDGLLVEDPSVTVSLLSSSGAIVVGPLVYSSTPHDGVVFKDSTGYHRNLPTSGVAPGTYQLRVRFDSASVVGDLLLPVDLR